MATIPSISLIPSGYKAGKVYSVLPTDGSGDLDFARTTTATRINKNGLIENVGNNVPRLDYEDGSCPSLLLEGSSRNLITYSEAFGNSYWTKSGASIEGDASTAGSDVAIGYDFNTGFSGLNATINSSTQFTLTADNGWIRKDGFLSANKSYLIRIAGTSTGQKLSVTNFLGSGLFKDITTTGAFDETFLINTTTGGIFFGGTNLSGSVIQITTFTAKEVQGFSAPSVDSPLGAFKLVEDTSNGSHYLRTSNINVTVEEDTTFSIFAKKGETNFIQLCYSSTSHISTNYSNFDLLNGSLGTVVGGSAKIELIGDFYKCSFTSTATATTATNGFALNIQTETSSRFESYTGDGTSGVYIFGAQLEQQSYATSYIPNFGTVEGVSRSADTANGSGNASTFNDSEGVLFAEISALADDSIAKSITINQSSTNILGFYYYQSRIDAYVKVGTNQFFKTHYLNPTENVKISLKYKQNDFALWINGFEVGSLVGSGITPSGLNKLSFSDLSANDFYGKTKQLQYFNTALTDSELETLTSYSSFNAMALALNYTIQ